MASMVMAGRWFQRLGHHYILAMLIVTRASGWIGGTLVIYYVDLILSLPDHIRHRFHEVAASVVFVALASTLVAGMLETRQLRRVLKGLFTGEKVDRESGRRAGREAVIFPVRHHAIECVLVPLLTLVPVIVILKITDDISASVMGNIAIAVFMGIAMAEMATFLIIERLLQPVIRYLLDQGVEIDYERLPVSRLHTRLTLSFSLILLTTALMIGTLAGERAADIIKNPDRQHEAVANLRAHAIYITIAAVVIGITFSTAMAQSVTSRVDRLVKAMKRVEQGSLAERLRPTGNDDIDILTRQFNAMVGQLERNNRTIRELNATLESKVHERTQQLSENKRELQKSLQQLQEHDRLKTEFFANVSHELRTPLTMIVAPVERMLEVFGPQLQGEVTSLLNVVRINSRRLLELINRLLDFSKLEAGQATLHREPVDLNTIVGEMVAAGTPLAEQRGVELVADCAAELPLLNADGEKIEIIVTNLLSNALKFTPRDGRVAIETACEGDEVRLTIRDSGIGIAEHDLERIFERFVQLDGSASREFSGTGLGLPLVREFLEMHGGRIQVESRLGEGSCFHCYLPVAESLLAAPQVAAYEGRSDRSSRFSDLITCDVAGETLSRLERAPISGAPKILVVDDTPEIRGLLGDILSERYNVIFAHDGNEGCEMAIREQPDLILSDVMMPHVDGYEFCRRMKQRPDTAQIPFIMLTAKTQRAMKIEGLEQGALDYLVKPFDADELRARVNNLLKLRSLHRDLDERNAALEKTLQELRATQTQLVHAEKMNSLGQLVAGLAHEINNAVNAVYNGIQPLRLRMERLKNLIQTAVDAQDDSPAAAEIRKTFDKVTLLANVVEEGASRTARIVSDMKTFSHPGSEAPALFDLHEAMDMCLNLLGHQLKHRVTVRKEYCPDGQIVGPRGQLGQVFMNILTNAQQAIGERGEIAITTRRNEQNLIVSIRDTGHGIPQEILHRIFDPFFTTKAPGIGTGLGLSISYGLITKLGGSIECHSWPGEGTEFIVTLPASKATPTMVLTVESPRLALAAADVCNP